MIARIARSLRVFPEETGTVVVLGALLLLNSVAMQVSYVSSVSGFLTEGGVNSILLVWMIDFLLIFLLTGVQTLVVDRFPRDRLMAALAAGFGLTFLALRLMFALGAPDSVSYALLYIMAEQQWLFFPLVFWTLANDVFSTAQATRVFPVIGSFGFIGQIVGLAFAASAPGIVASLGLSLPDLLVLNVALYLVAFVVIRAVLSRLPIRHVRSARGEPLAETLREGREFVADVPAFRYLALAVLALAVCETVVEFHFLKVSEGVFPRQDAYQTFYGLYRLATTAVAFAVQLLLTGRIIARLSLQNSFLVAPLAFLGSAVTMLLAPGVAGGTVAMSVLKITRDTIDESSRKALQNVVPEERRGRVSMFIDSYLLSLGTMLGCAITLFIITFAPYLTGNHASPVYLTVAALAALLAVAATIRMARTYEASMLNWRLRRRQRGASVLDRMNF